MDLRQHAHHPYRALLAGVGLAAIAGTLALAGRSLPSRGPVSAPTSAQAALASLPLIFEQNEGQADTEAEYLARGDGYTLALTSDRVLFSFPKRTRGKAVTKSRKATGSQGSGTIALKLVGSNKKASVVGTDQLPGKVNYYIGNDPSRWRTNVSTYEKVKVDQVYPGIDLVYYGNQKSLEYDFVVSPSADPDRIQMDVEGADRVELNASGDLLIHEGDDTFRQPAPVIYQEENGKRKSVEGGYVQVADGSIGFRIGDYDHDAPLVIDPVFIYSTPVGGTGADVAYAFGGYDTNLVIVGETTGGFPVTNTPYSDTTHGGGTDGFAIRLNTTATGAQQLVAATYVGGMGNDKIRTMLHMGGQLVVAGTTNSPDFPNAVNTHQGGDDAFVALLGATGDMPLGLGSAHYLGGAQNDTGESLAYQQGFWLAGTTHSTNFPTATGPSSGLQGASDPYLLGLDLNLGQILAHRVFNGTYEDSAHGLAVGPDGAFYLTGGTQGGLPGPTFGMSHSGGMDAYVIKATSAGGNAIDINSLRYIGGGNNDEGQDISVDHHGQAYVTGSTSSSNFPLMRAGQPTLGGGKDAFLTKLTPDGWEIDYSTYVGGSGDETGYSVSAGQQTAQHAIIGGSTSHGGLPAGSDGGGGGGGGAGFVTQINTLAYTFPSNSIVATAYIGGPGDCVYVVGASDHYGKMYALGATSGGVPSVNPFQGPTGTQDGFLSMFFFQYPEYLPAGRPALSAIPEGNEDRTIRLTLSSPMEIWIRHGEAPYARDTQQPYQLQYVGHFQGEERYHHINVVRGVKYWYVATSNEPSWSSNEAECFLPFKPPTLTAQAFSNTQIDLAWTIEDTAHTGFIIERQPNLSNVWTTIANPGKDIRSYSDTGLTAGATYNYRVTIYNDLTQTTSPTASTRTSAYPAAPSGLTATATAWNQVQLNWIDNSGSEDEFLIERSTSNLFPATSDTVITSAPSNTTSAMITGLQASTAYYFRVRARRTLAETYDSDYSNVAAVTTPVMPPAAPSGLSATPVSQTQINLSWVDASYNETAFQVERSPDNFATPALIVVLPHVDANFTSYQDSDLTLDTVYYYRVRAFNSGGNSAYSATASARTWPNDPPLAPSGLQVTVPPFPAGGSSLQLAWTDNSANEYGFKIERSTDDFANPANTVLVTTTAANVVSYLNSGLNSNTTYYYRVRATHPVGDSAPSAMASASTLPYPPAAPGDLVVSTPLAPAGATQLHLNWTDSSHNETAFEIERSTDSFADPANTVLVASNPSNNWSFTDTGLNSLTRYYYRVRARNADGYSAYSNVASAQTLQPPPNAPSNVQVTAASAPSGTTTLNISWQDNSTNEAGFTVERTGDGSTTTLGVEAGNGTTVSIQNTNLSPNTQYTYRVRAYNTSGVSTWSDPGNGYTLPVAPTGLTAEQILPQDANEVALAWTYSGTTPQGFLIERSSSGFSQGSVIVVVAETEGTVRSIVDASVQASYSYQYRVRAFNPGGYSAGSEDELTTLPDRPVAPSGLVVSTPDVGPNQRRLVLTWSDNSTNESDFKIERSTDNFAGDVMLLATQGANTVTYTDYNNLAADTVYYYRVRATNSRGDSANSNVASGTSQSLPPAAPTSLQAGYSGTTGIRLTWTDNSTNEAGFTVVRTNDYTDEYVELAPLPANTTEYVDTAVVADARYIYYVRAFNNGGSNYSNAAWCELGPAAPTGLTATVTTSTSTRIRLDWTDNSTNESGFRVERSTDNFATPDNIVLVTTTAANAVSLLVPSLTSSTTYYFRVCATGPYGFSEFSNVEVSRTSAPAAPSGLTATATSSSTVDLNWTDNSNNEDEFRIQRSGNGTDWVWIDTVPRNVTSYTATGLLRNKKYWFRVRAVNALGNIRSQSATAITFP